MGERLLCKQEVVGSIPSASTTRLRSAGDDIWRRQRYGGCLLSPLAGVCGRLVVCAIVP